MPIGSTRHGALGFWKAARKIWPNIKQQRCWVHKTANILNYLPKSVQSKAKTDLHAISEAVSRADAEVAFDRFIAKYEAKYDKAAGCLAKDRETLLAFYDFPAETRPHGHPDREYVRDRASAYRQDQGLPVARDCALAMVFKLTRSEERHLRRLNSSERLAEIIRGVRFRDGEPVTATEDQAAA